MQLDIKNKNLEANVFSWLQDHRSSYSEVLKKAAKKLEQVFGMQLVEIGDGPKKAYILVSLLDHNGVEEIMGWYVKYQYAVLYLLYFVNCGNRIA